MKKILLPLFLLTIYSSFSCGNPEPEDYLLPKGFIGRATVIFNQQHGAAPKYQDGRRVYEIPTSGICLTQFEPEYGTIDHRYFYIDGNGKKEQLEIFRDEVFKDSLNKANRNEVGIFSDGTTGQYAEDNKAPYQFFFVTSYNGFDSIETDDNFNKRISKVIGSNL